MENLTIKKILDDRYSYYLEAQKRGGFYWDEYFKSWVVFDHETINLILKDERFTAKRKSKYIEMFNIDDEYKKALNNFYSKWLMYMDGEEHIHLKRKIQKPISNINREVTQIADTSLNLITNSNIFLGDVDVINNIAIPFTNNFFASLFGINEDDYSNILNKAKDALKFLWVPSHNNEEAIKTITSINNTYSTISEIIENKRYSENRLLDLMIKEVGLNDDSLALIVNLIVDGHDPFLSSVKSYIYFHIKYKVRNIKNKQMVEETLRLECPFPLCARLSKEDLVVKSNKIQKGERVILFISSGNRDLKKYCPADTISELNSSEIQTFGVGVHYCIGATVTRQALLSLAKKMNNLEQLYEINILESKWEDSFGFRTLDKLKLKFIETSIV